MPGRGALIKHALIKRHRRLAAIVVVAGALVAPATIASAAGSGARANRCPAGAEDGVIAAYANVFSRATQLTNDARAASLDRGDEPAVRALLDTWLASPTGTSSTITVADVRCTPRRRALVNADLNLAGTPLPHVLPAGRARLRDGTWKVGFGTFCTRMILEDPSLAQAGVCAR